MEDEQGLYTIVVAVVGTATVTVHAESENEARHTAEACTSPLDVSAWSYLSDEVATYPSEQSGQTALPFDAV